MVNSNGDVMKPTSRLYLCLCIIVTIAATVSPVSRVFAMDGDVTLEHSLELFYKNNYDILINKYEIEKSYADYVGAKLLPNPTFTFNAIGLEPHMLPRTGDNTQITYRLDQLIELGGKKGLRTNAAQESLEAAKLTHRDTVRTLLAGFYTLFFSVKLDMLNAEVARDELGRHDRILDIAEKRFSAGHLSMVDYTKIRVARLELESNLISFEAQLRNDIEQFSFIIGSPGLLRPLVEVKDAFPQYREDELTTAGYQNRYDLLSLQKQQKAAEFNRSLAKAGRIPDVTVGAEYDTFGADNTSTVGGGLSFSLPLFNRNQGEILRRDAEYKQLEIQLEKVKKQIVVDIRQALNNFQSSQAILEAYKSRKGETDELLGRSERAFSLGGITALDLIDTQKTHRDFMTKYNQALVQSNLNEALIKIASGEIK